MKLMDSENGHLQKQIYTKEKRKAEKRETTQAHTRLMAATENLDTLAERDFKKSWKAVVKELVPKFKGIRKKIMNHEKAVIVANRAAARAAIQGRAHSGRQGHGHGHRCGCGRGRGLGYG